VIDVKGPFVLAKRGHLATRNADVLQGFGGGQAPGPDLAP